MGKHQLLDVVLVLFLVTVVASCGDDGQPSATSPTEVPAVGEVTPEVPAVREVTPEVPAVQEVTPEPSAPAVLHGDGIGPWTLGSDADSAIGGLADALGAPSLDSGWLSSSDESTLAWGCPRPQARIVEWAGVRTVFGASPDGPPPADSGAPAYAPPDGSPYFLGYRITGSGMRTDAGIGVGSTLAELRAAYGDQLLLQVEDYLNQWWFEIGGTGLAGSLSAVAAAPDDSTVPDDETTTVTGLHAGNWCFLP